VANHIGQVVFEEEQNRAELAWKLLQSGKLTFPTTKKKGALYLEIDGAMVHIRRQKEERPAAESETKSTWMENKLGMVFSSDNFIWWKDKKGERQHKIGKREYVSYLGEAEGFKKQFWAMALRNGYGTYEQTVLISDGATWIRNLKEEIFPDAQQILDFYHLCEAVGEFAKAFFKLDESKYKPWSDKMCELLRASRHQEVLDEINRLGKHRVAKIKPNLYNYIENNKNNIDYSEYKRKGWYIGSGAIESGNKTVLQRRLKQAGMRWNIENAQYIVSLMSKAKSDLWVKDVVHLVKSRYETRGAFKSLDGPLMLKLDFWESLLAEKGPFSLR
jgi:hypothetical protein